MLESSISFPHFLEVSLAQSDQVCARQSSTELCSANMAMAACYASYDIPTPQPTTRTMQQVQQQQVHQQQQVPTVQKDYSRPLHVDCSVEYELPNQAKPPQGVRNEPLLMIHPCYFRKIESQRRSPFVNNLPPTTRQISASAKRRMARSQQQQQPQVQPQMPQQAAQYPALQYATATALTAATERQQQSHHHHHQQPQQQQQQQQQPTTTTTQLQQQQQHHHHHHHQLWEPMPPLVPISAAAAAAAAVQQTYCKREASMVSTGCGGSAAYSSSGSVDSGHWTDPERSPDRPDDLKQQHHPHHHILTGKYRQYLRSHRLHPYVSSAIPIASTFPQMQQVCYNV